MQKTMIILYNNLLKRIFFPSLSIYFFPHFSHFFPSPNPNFGASWEKMGVFSILKIESLFPSLSIYFFPHFCPSPNSNFGVSWGKWGWTPSSQIYSKIAYLSYEKRPHSLFKLRTISYLLYSVYDDEAQILFLSYFGVNHPVLHLFISLYFNFQAVCTS